jgi:mRNA interferase MazF
MMTVKAGKLWIAEITFTDGSASKKRPVLILWIDGDDVVVAAVTSSKLLLRRILAMWRELAGVR